MPPSSLAQYVCDRATLRVLWSMGRGEVQDDVAPLGPCSPPLPCVAGAQERGLWWGVGGA